MRLALGLQYDGSAFHGWQTQADRRTVQDVVEEALAQIPARRCRPPAGTHRRPAHAILPVVHVDPPWRDR